MAQRTKARHRKAAHRIYMNIWLSNAPLFNDPVNGALTQIYYRMGFLAYNENVELKKGGKGLDGVSLRTAKHIIRSARQQANTLLHTRGLKLTTVRAWRREHEAVNRAAN